MTRLSTLSSAAIKAMYSSETPEALCMLVTIYSPVTNLPILYLADNFSGRLANLTTDAEIVYGVTSRNQNYIFLPMQVTLPTEQDTGVGQCSIILNYTTPEAIQLVRETLTKPTKILLELVLLSSPGVVEASFSEFYITSVTYSATQITFSLDMISLNREPFPCYNFTPGYFPGLF